MGENTVMATNDFKAFATGTNANVMSQEEWEALPAVIDGFTSGKASSAQVNKALRQASFVAAALAQFVAEKTDSDVSDDGDIAAFVAKLTSGFAAQYLSRENPFGDIAADGETAISTALANLGLGEAAKRSVGTGTNQIPDMSSFASYYGVCRLPSGVKIQVMTTPSAVAGRVTVNFNIAFTASCWIVIPIDTSENPSGVIGWGYAPGSVTLTSATLFNSNSSTESCKVLAIGI
jgi:hypothetical protein